MIESEQDKLLQSMDESLSSIRKILEIQARPALIKELEAFASTSERRKMWILSNGELSNEEIAKKVGSTLRTVQYFVQEGRSAGLIVMAKRGFPKRAIDLLPKEWKEHKGLEKPATPSTGEMTSEQ